MSKKDDVITILWDFPQKETLCNTYLTNSMVYMVKEFSIMTKPRKNVLKIALLFLLIGTLLTQCNYAIGIDFRLIHMLETAENEIKGNVYLAFSDCHSLPDRVYTSYDAYLNLDINESRLIVKLENGERKLLTIESMAQMDEVANALYKLTKSKTTIFRPKITMKFSKAAYDEYGLYLVMLVQDYGGWAHLIWYRYYPEDNELIFWGWKFICDHADAENMYDVPYD